MIIVEEVCKTFTEDQLHVLYVLISNPDSEVSKIIESYIRYNAYFKEASGGIIELKYPLYSGAAQQVLK